MIGRGLLSVAVLLAACGTALSCSCAPFPLEETIERSKAIFVGRPLEVRRVSVPSPSGGNFLLNEVVFKVEMAWKGTPENVLTVLTEYSSATCGYFSHQFDPEARYLIYARDLESVLSTTEKAPLDLTDSPYPLETTICTRNAVLSGPILDDRKKMMGFNFPSVAQEDLAALGEGFKPVPSGDVNRDGVFTLPDVQLALRLTTVLVTSPIEGQVAGDMNEDGRLDTRDVILLLRKWVSRPIN